MRKDPNILTGLDTVDWENLRHAYGSAHDVPQLLYELTSPDSDVRDNAWGELYGNLWHQGTIYEATSYAVPFLLQLLQAPSVSQKELILVYLGDLASASSNGQNNEYLALTRAAVDQGYALYLDFITDEHPLVRAAAAYVLGFFPAHQEVVDKLITHFTLEKDALVCVAIVLTLGHFTEASHLLDWLLTHIRSGESTPIRVAAALSLAQLQRSVLADEARALLLDTLRHPDQAGELFEQLPWDKDDIQDLCEQALLENGIVPDEYTAAQELSPSSPKACTPKKPWWKFW